MMLLPAGTSYIRDARYSKSRNQLPLSLAGNPHQMQ
jgi:hypothetical protein